jgi:hypothetical protein
LDNFDIILQHNISAITVLEVGLKLKQHFFRRHDYAIFMKKINGASSVIISPAQLLCNLLVYHIGAFKLIKMYLVIGKHLATQCFYSTIKDTKSDNHICNPVSRIVGSGISKLFTAEELQPFIDGTNAQKFRFINYLTHPEAAILQGSNITLISGNIPLIILAPKLRITELKVIAKCHHVTVHFKIKIQDIQTILFNHMCGDCQKYITVFEMIYDSDVYAKKKRSQLNVVKKYQANSSNYQTSHLAAVKQSQANDPDYKISNLNAVKKSQVNNSDYKTSHLNAVKKSQVNNPDYKILHLNAVQKSQVNNPDYKISHLTAVKKNQVNDPDYKTSHFNAVKKSQVNDPDYKISHLTAVKKSQKKQSTLFPPTSPSKKLQHTIISNFCKDTTPEQFVESGCAVCRKLTPILKLTKLSETDLNLNILIQPGMSQQERTSSDHPIVDIDGPILDNNLNSICKSCFKSVSQEKVPLMALANGKWIGKVPFQLEKLSFAEQLLVARVWHNYCLVRVSSGIHKMRANAITFANPMPKIYDILLPPIEEMDDVLAFIYTGPCMPTKSYFE